MKSFKTFINESNNEKNIYQCIRDNDIESLKKIIDSGADLENIEEDDDSALEFVFEKCDDIDDLRKYKEMIELLIDSGAKFNMRCYDVAGSEVKKILRTRKGQEWLINMDETIATRIKDILRADLNIKHKDVIDASNWGII
jgi:hypothetical protein